jgi:hypothetical protein
MVVLGGSHHTRPGDPGQGAVMAGDDGAWPSGKARDFGSRIRGFESLRPNHLRVTIE